SIAGRMLGYLPFEPIVSVSQRIEDEVERESLIERVQNILGVEGKGGYIVRTLAEDASDEELESDVKYLNTMWTSIQSKATSSSAPSLLHTDLTLEQRVLRDMVTSATNSIMVDSRTTCSNLIAWAKKYTPSVSERIKHYRGERHLFDLANIDEEIKRCLSRRVDLKSGGYRIIDQTEALTIVDVNTGVFDGGRNFDDTIFKPNLEAAVALARQMRLRNLSGIIIDDFIDMDNQEHQAAV